MNKTLFNNNMAMQTIFKFLLITTFLMSPLVAGAVGYTLLEPLPCIRGNGVTCTTGEQITSPDFKTYVQYLFNLAIAIAAVSAVFMIVWGGFQYMTSEAPGVKSDGLKKVQNAVYGLLLVLSSFLILKTIDPRLVEISSTLVDPLKIKCPTNEKILRSDPECKKDVISDFFARMAGEAENYKVQNLEVINQWKEEKIILTQLEQKKQELLNALVNTPNLSTQQTELLKAQIQDVENKINEMKSKIILSSAKSNILASTAISLNFDETSNPTENTVKGIQEAKTNALKHYNKKKAELEAIGNSADKIKELDNLYYPIHGSLVLQQNSLASNDTSITYKIGQINQMLLLDLPKITDQTKKDTLQADADKLIERLNNLLANRKKAFEVDFGNINNQPGQ